MPAINRLETLRFMCRCLGEPTHWGSSPESLQREITAGRINWQELVRVSSEDRFYLTIAVYEALTTKRLDQTIPRDLMDYFEAIREFNATRNRKLIQQCLHLAKLLNSIGVEPVLIKGSGNIASGLYSDPAVRIMDDLDVLVPPDRVQDCNRLLLKTGYRRCPLPAPLPNHHHLDLLQPDEGVGLVELHSTISQVPSRCRYESSDIYTYSERLPDVAVAVRVPSLACRIIIGIQHSLNSTSKSSFFLREHVLRDLYDVGLLMTSATQEDWDRLMQYTTNAGLEHPFRERLNLAKALFGARLDPRFVIPGSGRFSWWRYDLRFRFPRLGRIDEVLAYVAGTFRCALSRTERGRLKRKDLLNPSWYWFHLRCTIQSFRHPTTQYDKLIEP